MNTSLVQNIEEQKTNLFKSELNKYLVDKNEIRENPNRIWFKGSRYR